MLKSYIQQRLEAQHDSDIREIVAAAFCRFQGHKNMVTLVAAELDVTTATLYRWCGHLGIDIDDFRKQEVNA